jgi:hypothetical protein
MKMADLGVLNKKDNNALVIGSVVSNILVVDVVAIRAE